MRPGRSLPSIVPLLTLVGAACSSGETVPPMTSAVRDSAGVTVVDNSLDTAAARAGWSIAPEPTLVIGGLDAPESQQLFQVGGARRLGDGRIVVADGGDAEVRVYGPDGTLLHAHGGKGEGPGEFMNPRVAGVLAGDSVLVYDSNLRRVTIVHADAGYIRSYRIGTEGGGYPIAFGSTGDGGVAIGGGMYFSSEQGFPSGVVRPNSRYVLLAPDGTVRGDLGDVPAAEMFARSTETMFSAVALPFGRVTAAAARDDAVWLGTGDAWEIRRYTPDATLTTIVRFDRERAPVTDRLREADMAESLEDAETANDERDIRNLYADMDLPTELPPYQLMVVDATGSVWIGEYLPPREIVRTYTVVDATGRVTGRVDLPARTQPLDIGAGYLLGLTRDDLDVERLTLWTVTRP